jgi:membrane protein
VFGGPKQMSAELDGRGPGAIPRLLLASIRRLFADEAVPLAGNIAFRSIFSLFPFLIFLTAIAGFVGTEEQAAAAVSFLLDIAPENLVRPLESEIRSILTVPRADLLSLAALLTIWSAMAGVDSVRVGLNRAYDLRDERSAWLVYLIDILFVVGSAIAFLIFSFLVVLMPLALRFAATHGIDLIGRFSALEELRLLLALVLMVLGVTFAHLYLPARRLAFRKIWPGVVLTVIVWMGLALVFSYWLFRFNSFASTYASLSGIFAAMFFVYMAALVLILGGELNRVLDLLDRRENTEISQSPEL